MKVKDAMSSPVATCQPGTSLAAAGLEMLRHDCGVLPVVDDDGGMVGIITDRDICMAVSTRSLSAHQIRVGTVMTATLNSVGPEETVEHALDVMARGHVHRLPVVDARWKLVGIISINDIALMTGSARGHEDGPSCADVLTAMRGIHAHWRPHVLDVASIHPIVPSERPAHEHEHGEETPVVQGTPGWLSGRGEQQEPIEHSNEYDWEE